MHVGVNPSHLSMLCAQFFLKQQIYILWEQTEQMREIKLSLHEVSGLVPNADCCKKKSLTQAGGGKDQRGRLGAGAI